MSRATVVIATRDRMRSLSRTLDRLRELPDRPAIVVVDNASRDGTADMVAARYPDVRLIRCRRNLGAVARNLGVEAATTGVVAFADDDSWWAPHALTTAADLFDAYPRLGLVAARILVGPHARRDPLDAVLAAGTLGQHPDLPGPSVLGFLACGAVVRRNAFLDAGGFDPVVFFMGEEERLAYDLRAAGWGLSYCDTVVAYHHPAGSTTTKRRLAARNTVLTAWLRRPLRVAAARTGALLRHRDIRTAAAVAARLPRALAARRPPHPAVEAELRLLEIGA